LNGLWTRLNTHGNSTAILKNRTQKSVENMVNLFDQSLINLEPFAFPNINKTRACQDFGAVWHTRWNVVMLASGQDMQHAANGQFHGAFDHHAPLSRVAVLGNQNVLCGMKKTDLSSFAR
jgi:hypothetical protein